MSRKIENVVYRASCRDFILANFAGRSFSIATRCFNSYLDHKVHTALLRALASVTTGSVSTPFRSHRCHRIRQCHRGCPSRP
jgi:hypothetical protein